MTTRDEKFTTYVVVDRESKCRDCSNTKWFDEPTCWVCTTCLKTVGKNSSEWRRDERDEAAKKPSLEG